MTTALRLLNDPGPDRGDLDSLAESFAIFVHGVGLAPSTRDAYGKSIRAFSEWLIDAHANGVEIVETVVENGKEKQKVMATFAPGEMPVMAAELRRSHLAAYMVFIAGQLTRKGKLPKRSSTATTYRHLQQWFRWMVEEKEIESSPLAHLKAQKPDKVPVPIYDVDNVKALIAGCADDLWGRRDEAIIRLLLDSGPRISEVVGMNLADVNWKRHTIRVRGKGKNGERRERDIPVGPKTLRALDRYRRLRDRHPRANAPELWLGYRHRRPTTSALAKMIERRCKRAGVEHVNPHRFRHTFAHLFRAGKGEIHQLMSICGWDSEVMARQYGASAIADEAIERHGEISPGELL